MMLQIGEMLLRRLDVWRRSRKVKMIVSLGWQVEGYHAWWKVWHERM